MPMSFYMVIDGWNDRIAFGKTLDHFCEGCWQRSTFAEARDVSWFHMFWIPLFRTHKSHVGYDCLCCGARISEEELVLDPLWKSTQRGPARNAEMTGLTPLFSVRSIEFAVAIRSPPHEPSPSTAFASM